VDSSLALPLVSRSPRGFPFVHPQVRCGRFIARLINCLESFRSTRHSRRHHEL
jgi:hypothetical protein